MVRVRLSLLTSQICRTHSSKQPPDTGSACVSARQLQSTCQHAYWSAHAVTTLLPHQTMPPARHSSTWPHMWPSDVALGSDWMIPHRLCPNDSASALHAPAVLFWALALSCALCHQPRMLGLQCVRHCSCKCFAARLHDSSEGFMHQHSGGLQVEHPVVKPSVSTSTLDSELCRFTQQHLDIH
jgi:hypothetical protein